MEAQLMANLADQAIASGFDALAKGDLALAQKSESYAWNTATQIADPTLAAVEESKAAGLQDRINELKAQPEKVATLQQQEQNFVAGYTKNMADLDAEEKANGQQEKEHQYIEDAQNWGAIGAEIFGGARAAKETVAKAVADYRWQIYGAGAVAALLATAAIAWRLA